MVLMDIRMPRLDGLEATRRIVALDQAAAVRVLVLTTFDLDEYVYEALRAGASGFLLKDTPPADLLAAIRVVAAGDALLAPSVTRRLIAEFARRPEPSTVTPAALAALTDREREVLALVARGLSNAEIAERLVVSAATAKTHVSRVLAKLQARDRAQLVMLAYETGLVTPGSARQATASLGRRPAPPQPPGRRASAAARPTTPRLPARSVVGVPQTSKEAGHGGHQRARAQQALRRRARRRPARLRRRPRDGDRFPRPQRGRQDDHPADAPRPGHPDLGHGHDRRPALP